MLNLECHPSFPTFKRSIVQTFQLSTYAVRFIYFRKNVTKRKKNKMKRQHSVNFIGMPTHSVHGAPFVLAWSMQYLVIPFLGDPKIAFLPGRGFSLSHRYYIIKRAPSQLQRNSSKLFCVRERTPNKSWPLHASVRTARERRGGVAPSCLCRYCFHNLGSRLRWLRGSRTQSIKWNTRNVDCAIMNELDKKKARKQRNQG